MGLSFGTVANLTKDCFGRDKRDITLALLRQAEAAAINNDFGTICTMRYGWQEYQRAADRWKDSN